MKHGLKPTKKQKQFIQSKRLDANNWLVERETPDKMVIVHRKSGNSRQLYKL
jgi:hypothetical protein